MPKAVVDYFTFGVGETPRALEITSHVIDPIKEFALFSIGAQSGRTALIKAFTDVLGDATGGWLGKGVFPKNPWGQRLISHSFDLMFSAVGDQYADYFDWRGQGGAGAGRSRFGGSAQGTPSSGK